jgi:hypothetical protein
LFVVAGGYLLAPLRHAGQDRQRPEIARALALVAQGQTTFPARYQYDYVVLYHALSDRYEVRYELARRELTLTPR